MIQPGLERISQLLRDVKFPWRAIHVAGTNGKGSICHYAANILRQRKVKCGKFTSPHLVDRWDCISINGKPVDETLFQTVEKHYLELSLKNGINASPFEILTATAFDIFTQEQVQIGVVEVGMGGKLDATNILNNQAISVISKIAHDHQDFLGTTLEQIALHKAGILRTGVPYIINPSNEQNIQEVIQDYAKTINAGPQLGPEAHYLHNALLKRQDWKKFSNSLPLAQQDNAILASIAAREAAKTVAVNIRPFDIARGLVKSRVVGLPGRMERVRVPPIFGNHTDPKGRHILIDGAHNPDAAKALNRHLETVDRQYRIPDVGRPPPQGWRVTWILAMTEGKDAREYLSSLLKPGDNVITTSFGPVDGMPWVKPMDPKQLLDIAYSVQPSITGLAMPKDGAFRALCAAKFLTQRGRPIVLTGSLYLVGDFHRELRSSSPQTSAIWWRGPDFEKERQRVKMMLSQERDRVNQLLSHGSSDQSTATSGKVEKRKTEWSKQMSDREKKQAIQEEMEKIDREMALLSAEEEGIKHRKPSDAEISSESVSPPQSSSYAVQTDNIEEEKATDPEHSEKPMIRKQYYWDKKVLMHPRFNEVYGKDRRRARTKSIDRVKMSRTGRRGQY